MPLIKTQLKDSGTPITMRFPQNVVDQLKTIARRKSVDTNTDISYVDLIRDATASTYDIEIDDKFDIGKFDFEEDDSETRGFWTAENIHQFNETPIGKMLAKCIEEDDYAEFVKLYKEKLKHWINNRSLATKVLEKSQGINGMCLVERDLASVAFVVKRRGAVPDQIMEGEEIIIPKFEIAAHPTIKLSELKPHTLFDVMVKPIISIQRELDSNIVAALSAAVNQRQDQIITNPGNISPSCILTAFENIAQHYEVPHHIIMHPKQYIKLACFSKGFVNSPPLKEALETRKFGSIEGVEIIVSPRCEYDEILVTAAPKHLGVLFMPVDPNVKHSSDTSKLRESFIPQIQVGICIVNDYTVSAIHVR